MSTVTCTQFRPQQQFENFCLCGLEWGLHPQVVKSKFFMDSETALASKVVEEHQAFQARQPKCTNYWPSKDWVQGGGEPIPTCKNCGKSWGMPNHSATDAMKGVKAYRAQQRGETAATRKQPCGLFFKTDARPGTCGVCSCSWIEHTTSGRTLVIEGYYQAHQPHCKCIVMNGDVECNCLTDNEKQTYLDKLATGAVKEDKVSCRNFKSKSRGNSTCGHCGEGFYLHSKQARQNHDLFLHWRQFNQSDAELLEWFMSLPGKDRDERLLTLRRFLSDPDFKYKPDDPHMINPDVTVIAAMLEAITGEQQVRPVKALLPASSIRHGLEPKPLDPLCFSCEENAVSVEGTVCSDCAAYYKGQGTPIKDGPVLRVEVTAEELSRTSNDRGGS